MACLDHQTELVAFLYQELDAGEEARFREHLESCPECREELNALRQVRRRLQESAPAGIPPAPASAVRVGDTRERFWRGLTLAAAGLAAVALGLGVWTQLRAAPAPGTARPVAGAPTPQATSAEWAALREEIEALRAGLGDASLSDGAREDLIRAVDARVARLEAEWRRQRQEDLDRLLETMAAMRLETGAHLARTEQLLRRVAAGEGAARAQPVW